MSARHSGTAILCCLACGLALAPPLHGARFLLDSDGILVDAGELGTFIIAPPTLETDNGRELRAVVSLDSNGGMQSTFENGMSVDAMFSESGDRVTWRIANTSRDAVVLKFTTLLPINWNQGSRFILGSEEGEFPMQFGPQMLAHGESEHLEIIHPLGIGISITTPGAYQQIQDNRAWNWNTFAWIFRYELRRHPGETEFSFSVSAKAKAENGLRFLVDRFGQSARSSWPDKIRSEADLRATRGRPEDAVEDGPAVDRFGGLAESGTKLGLEKTGFFHVSKTASGRHMLVTPDGNAFFQLAVCGIANTDDHTLVRGRERIFEWLPDPTDPKWLAAWRDQRPDWGIFSFQIANWIRKYGTPYSFEDWTAQAVARLRSWGFNSAGAFTQYSNSMREMEFPHVAFLPHGREDGVIYLPDRFGADDIMDPFAPGVEDALDRAYARVVAPQAADPLLIGYFLGNEQHFETLTERIPAYRASEVAAKTKLGEMLRDTYRDISAFNAAWNPPTPFADFEELGESPLFVRTEASKNDMRAFFRLFLERYYTMIRRVFERHDGNYLLLGSRWTPRTATNNDVVEIGGRHLDVVSVNYYTPRIDRDFLLQIHEQSGGRPILLSEWFYGASDQGLAAGTPVEDQIERGNAYRDYLEQSAATGVVVGSQWFLYTDQAASGRFFEGFNGEGNNTGFVDVTDQPYAPLVSAAMKSHARIYDVLFGSAPPFANQRSSTADSQETADAMP